MPLREGDREALIFLYRELLPYMIAGRRVKRLRLVWLDNVFRDVGDVAAALSGLGVGGSVVGVIAHSDEASGDLLGRLTRQLGPRWFFVGLAAIVVWIIIRLFIQNERVSQRATLARQFAVDNERSWGDLYQALGERTPQPGILKVHVSTHFRVQSAVIGRIWPFETYRPPLPAFQPELDRPIDEIRETFMAKWDPPQPGQEG